MLQGTGSQEPNWLHYGFCGRACQFRVRIREITNIPIAAARKIIICILGLPLKYHSELETEIAIIDSAMIFALRGMLRCFSQSRSDGPKKRWLSSHS